MPSFPQRARYQNHIIKHTPPSKRSSRDIYAITAVIFLKDRPMPMCPLVSILSRGTLPREDISPHSPRSVNKHWPCRDLKRTLQGGPAESKCWPVHGAILLISLADGRPPIIIILYERISLRKIQIQIITPMGFSLQI